MDLTRNRAVIHSTIKMAFGVKFTFNTNLNFTEGIIEVATESMKISFRNELGDLL